MLPGALAFGGASLAREGDEVGGQGGVGLEHARAFHLDAGAECLGRDLKALLFERGACGCPLCDQHVRDACALCGHVSVEAGHLAFEGGLAGEVLAPFGVGFATGFGKFTPLGGDIRDPGADEGQRDEDECGGDQARSAEGCWEVASQDSVSNGWQAYGK
jgi:hypothetical protein